MGAFSSCTHIEQRLNHDRLFCFLFAASSKLILMSGIIKKELEI